MNLGGLEPGRTAIIEGFSGSLDLQSRLAEMGLLKGTRVRVIKKAPFKGPLELKIRDYYVSIRWKDACQISISL